MANTYRGKDIPRDSGERWKPIEGYGNKYFVSNLGKVWSFASKKMRPLFRMRNGYYRFNLPHGNKTRLHLIHRAVAIAFIPNPDNKPEVNHKWGDKSDNRACALEWVTGDENKQHAKESGNWSIGINRPDAKLAESDIPEIITDRAVNKMTLQDISDKYNISITAVRHILTGRNWSHVQCADRDKLPSKSSRHKPITKPHSSEP